ncbi:MAG: hypothetical protein A2Y14_02040 [Verrucomicrobia bacterium GWF2_51_19]|nr:MAG: hypothetical protein A2Y14_02040 [Verrucomicrobia bacterium GWF2_51_19]HCJ12051.1 hypothetical protein [Opitutae bacterium]
MEKINKYFLVLGGFLGFILTFIVSFSVDNDIVTVVRNSTIGCIVGAVLTRFLEMIFWSAVRSSSARKQQDQKTFEEVEAKPAAKPEKPSAKK